MPGIKWTSPKTLHVTLKFCGERGEETVALLIKNLEKIKAAGDVDISVDGITFFPSACEPRVVAGKITGDEKRLKDIYERVERVALGAGIDRERRCYTPHVTLGRRNATGPLGEDASVFFEREPLKLAPWRFDSITLMKSELYPSGPEYTCLGVFKI